MVRKPAGIAGVIAGIALIAESLLFMVSGWSAEKFADPAAASEVLRTGGSALRAATAFGAIGLAATVLLLVGLAERLRQETPSASAATLWFGVIGVAGHALVPLSHWVGVPAFVAWQSRTRWSIGPPGRRI